jgi:hypothetical protein
VGYSPERKSAVLKRMLPPNNVAIRQLAQEEGISEATLHKWRAEARLKGQLMPDADAGPEGWSSRDKFAAVLETATLNEADLGEYCRPSFFATGGLFHLALYKCEGCHALVVVGTELPSRAFKACSIQRTSDAML